MPAVLMSATIVLAVLKATGTIAIDWIWVFCPLWIPLATMLAVTAVWLGILLIGGLVGLVVHLIDR